MRLAVLSPYTDPVKGGITSYTRELVRAYREMGVETLGLAEAGEANACFDIVRGTKTQFCMRSTFRILRWRADVVHGHSHWPELLPGLVVKMLRPRTRVVFTLHTPPGDAPPATSPLRRASLAIFGVMLRLCDGVSFASRGSMIATGLPPRIPHSVVHAAPERFVGDAKAHAEALPKEPVVLAVTVLVWPQKVAGLLLLLDAFAAVAPSFPDWRLVVLGDGPLRTQVNEKISSLRLDGRVVLKGFVDNVADEMVSASIFTEISLHEGLPIALLNAMGLGLPVVATAIGEMPEVIQNHVTGLVVEPTKEGVAEALTDLLRDPQLRRRLGKAAKDWTATELSWRRVALDNLRLIGVTPP